MPTVPSASTQAFPKRERIAKRRDFVRIYDEGRRVFSRYSVVFVAPNEVGHPRLGITVTRKMGKANERNRLKRWVREVYRRRRSDLGLLNLPVDLVVNVKAAARAAKYAEFAEDLAEALGRATSARRLS